MRSHPHRISCRSRSPREDDIPGFVDVLILGCGPLLDPEWRQESIVDPLLEGVLVDGLPEVCVGVHVVRPLRSGSESDLHGGGEVLEDSPSMCSSLAPPLWHSSIITRSKKSGEYFPK